MDVFSKWKKVAVAGGMVAAMTLGAAVGVNAQAAGPNEGPPAPEPRAGTASPSESVFVPITPCRIVNTTIGSKVGANQTRAFKSQGNTASQGGATSCGIPASASAIEVNMTGTFASGNGYLRVAPTGTAIPTATFLNYEAGFNASNAGTIALKPGAGTNFQVKAFVAPTHLVVDVLGYYVKGLMAVVETDGTLARGNGVVSTTKIDGYTGAYEVVFDRNVRGCSFTATRDAGAGTSSGQVQATTRVGKPNGAYVDTRTSEGVLEDAPFNLVVAC